LREHSRRLPTSTILDPPRREALLFYWHHPIIALRTKVAYISRANSTPKS